MADFPFNVRRALARNPASKQVWDTESIEKMETTEEGLFVFSG